MANWNTSNYHQRKAQRQAKAPCQWVQNPETEEWFYLRKVGAMSSLIAGMMPSALTGYAVGQWKEQGMDIGSEDVVIDAAKAIEENHRDIKMMASVVGRACVIPLLVPKGDQITDLDPEYVATVSKALAEKYDDFNEKEFEPKSIMLDAEDLDDSDVLFIFKWATGSLGAVQLAGGQVMNVTELKSVPKKLARGSRASITEQ